MINHGLSHYYYYYYFSNHNNTYVYIYTHTYVLYVCAYTYTQWFFPIETVKLPAALQLWSCVARGWDLLAEILETENAKGFGGTGGATERLHICPLLLIHGICCDMSYDLVTYLMIFYLLRFYDMYEWVYILWYHIWWYSISWDIYSISDNILISIYQ